MRTRIGVAAAFSFIAAAALGVAGGASGHDSHVNCANDSGYFSNYATRWIGPHWTHWIQWSSGANDPYKALRMAPGGEITYAFDVRPGGAFDVHFNTGDNYRYSGEKNLNGAYNFWFIAHWRAPSSTCFQ